MFITLRLQWEILKRININVILFSHEVQEHQSNVRRDEILKIVTLVNRN